MERINLINFYPPQRIDRYPTPLTLGVARLGAYLSHRQQEVRIISLPLGEAAPNDVLMRGDPTIVGFTVNFWDRTHVLRTLEEIRAGGFNGDILLGGPEAGILRLQQTPLPTPDKTFIVPYDGEPAMDSYLDRRHLLQRNEMQALLATPVRMHGRVALPVGLTLFSPAFQELLTSDFQRDSSYTWYDTVRGCPYTCGYCDHGRNRRNVSAYPEEHVEEEITNIGRKYQDAFVIDPIIGGGNPHAAVHRLRQFNSLAPSTALEYYLRPEMITEEVVAAAKVTNTRNIFVGLQTLNPAVPHWLRKNNPSSLPRITELCQGAPVTVELIVGLPGDTLEGLKVTLRRVAEELHPRHIAAYSLSVLDGTQLRENLDAHDSEIWVERNPETHRATASSSYSSADLQTMTRYAAEFVAEYNLFS